MLSEVNLLLNQQHLTPFLPRLWSLFLPKVTGIKRKVLKGGGVSIEANPGARSFPSFGKGRNVYTAAKINTLILNFNGTKDLAGLTQ
jgi:hypothetical protein